VPEFAQATGRPDYTHNTTVNLDGLLARYVRLTMKSSWSGARPYSLSEVRFFQAPMRAFQPDPIHGGAGVGLDATLSWRPGREAVSHEVYIGTDPNTLSLAQTVAEHQVALASLGAGYGKTYYWRVDEVNEAAAVRSWTGDLWSLSTAEYEVVDDFESYNDRCSRIYYTWQSGAANSENAECGVPAFAGNGTGSVVGHDDAPYAERTAVHSGQQSMPLAYDGESEAMRAFESAQDWTQGGVQTLVLFFRGDPANGAGQLYIKVNQRRIPYTGDPGALARPLWRQWNVDLTSVPGLHAVQTLTIGVSGSARGRIFIDDIRLYRAAPEIPVPVDPGAEVLVARYPFEGDLQDHSGHSRHGAPGGNPVFVDSQPGLGRAVQFNGIDDHVALPIGTAVSGLTSATVATWVRFDPASTGSWQRIFDFGTGTTAYMFLTPRQGTSGTMRFAIRTTASAGESSVDAPGTLPGDWHHVAVAIEGQAKTMQLWLDGEVVANGPTATLPKDLGATTQNWLGRSQFEVDGYFGGVLDEFHIYDRALSVGEVRYLAGDR